MKFSIARPDARGYFPRILGQLRNVALGNGSQYEVLVASSATGYRVHLIGYCAVEVRADDAVRWTALAEKLGLKEADARNLADLINDQILLHHQGGRPAARQGRYRLQFVDAVRDEPRGQGGEG